MNTPSRTDSLCSAVADSLRWLEEYGFRYLKSKRQFIRKSKSGFASIVIDVATWDHVDYLLAFHLSVQIIEVQEWIRTCCVEANLRAWGDLTISNYTVNVGPKCPNWTFPIEGSWWFRSIEAFEQQERVVSDFVRELGLPFILEHEDPRAVRRTLLDNTGHATNIVPYQQILAVDILHGTREQLEKDIAILDSRYAEYAPEFRKAFDEFVAAVRIRAARGIGCHLS